LRTDVVSQAQSEWKGGNNIFVNLAIDNTTTAGINYKELYDCKWDLMTLTNNKFHTFAFTFHFNFIVLMMSCIVRK
jgi:hypothetical protein